MAKYYAVKEGRKPGIYKTWNECQEQVNKFSGAKFKKFSNLEEAKAFMTNVESVDKDKEYILKEDSKEKFVKVESEFIKDDPEIIKVNPVDVYVDIDIDLDPGDVLTYNIFNKDKEIIKNEEVTLLENINDNPIVRKSNYKVEDVKKNMSKNECVAYVDGSAIKNQRYSYGMIFFSTEGVEESFNAYTDDLRDMRNVSGELRGAVKAIQKALELNKKRIYLHYDYIGIEKWATGEWRAKKEGTQQYKEFYDSIKSDIDVVFIKVKAHTGDQFNEVADSLAKEALGI